MISWDSWRLPALDALLNDHEKVALRLEGDEHPVCGRRWKGRRSSPGPSGRRGSRRGCWRTRRRLEGGLPLLAHMLQELWRRRHGRLLSHEAYEKLGRVGERWRRARTQW